MNQWRVRSAGEAPVRWGGGEAAGPGVYIDGEPAS